MKYKATFHTSTYEADFRNRLRLSSILNYMQEVAARNADQLGFGYQDFQHKGLFWVLSRVKILIHDIPLIGESITVETWPKNLSSLFALRDFNFYNDSGAPCGKATTAWIIMNQSTRRPLRPETLMRDTSWAEGVHAIQEVPGRLESPGNLQKVNDITAAYSDIDVNQHINNVKYVEYILDSFSQKELSDLEIHEFQINFLMEGLFGDHIIINKGLSGDATYFEGIKSDNSKVFQALIGPGSL